MANNGRPAKGSSPTEADERAPLLGATIPSDEATGPTEQVILPDEISTRRLVITLGSIWVSLLFQVDSFLDVLN